jgi:hypothetical protein
VLFGLKVPAPPVQIPDEVGPLTEPDKIEFALFSQDDKSIPA